MLSIHRSRRWLARIFAVTALVAVGHVHAASTGSTSLLRVTGSEGGTGFGDYVSDNDALRSFYKFYVEVPPGTSSLQIDIFDADVGQAGNADDTGNRDRLRNAFNTRTEYRLFNPGGTQVATNFTQGTNTLPANADNAWLNLFTTANPATGHWRVEVDSSPAETTGDDVNAFGLRAHDGSPTTSAGTELNIYADNLFQIGINPVNPGSRTSVFNLYPYVTHGCDYDANDFDYDSGDALTVGGNAQSHVITNRPGSFSTSWSGNQLSDNNAWNAETAADPLSLTGFGISGNEITRDGYGIAPATWRINEVDNENANFATIYVGPGELAAPAPTANPQANAFRVYFPTDASAAPLKPYLVQYYAHNSGPNPPQSGQQTFFDVSVVMVNPTPYPIQFSGTTVANGDIVSTFVGSDGNGAAVYVGGSATVDQGTLISTPATAGNFAEGLILWNPGTVGANDAAVLRYRARVTPNSGATGTNRRFTGEGPGTASNNGHGTRARFVDETGASSQTQARYTVNGLCGLSYRVGTSAPVPVTLSWVAASRTAGSIHVEWATASETRNGGFDVFGRRADGSWMRLTDAPLLSKAADGVEEQSYAATVSAPADVAEIAIEDIALDGARTRHDAVPVGSSRGARAATPIEWGTIDRSLPTAANAGSGRVYLEVRERGIYRVSVATLAAAGQDVAGLATRSLALRDAAGPVPVRIIGAIGATLGPDAVLEFIGEPRKSLYGSVNRYAISADPAAALRPGVSALDPADARRERDRWRGDAIRGDDRVYSLGALGDDPWFDTLLAASAGNPVSYAFALDLPGALDLDHASVALEFEGETDWPQDADHRVDIAVNGTFIARHEFDGRTTELARFPVPVGVLRTGGNQVAVTLPADHGVPFDRIRLNSVSIRYDRALRVAQGRLVADLGEAGDTVPVATSGLMRDGFDEAASGCDPGGCTLLRVGGVTGLATAWQRTSNGQATLVLGVPGDGSFDLVVQRAIGELFVAQEDSVLEPTLVTGARPVGDVPSGTDFVVVAHPAFAGALGSFVTARQAEGLDVVVASTDAIYSRYSGGIADAAAIRRFLSESHARGARYALLVGGDTYDYGNHLGTGATSFVPTMYTWTDADVRYAPSDALLGDVDGDGLPEIAVGRWPVRTTAELDTIVAKTLSYATAPHAAKAVFAADNAEEVEFGQLSAFVASAMAANGWTVDRIDVATPDASTERAALVGAINEGRALTHFVGHAGVDRWTFEPLLLAGQIDSLLTNATRPTVVAQWGCWSSYFVSPFANSVAHQFLFDTDGGAAAVIGASTRIQNGEEDEALRSFVLGIGAGDARIGDAIDAMRRATAASGDRRDLVYGINLLGDPTLKLRR